ncbi:hypothetical protein DFR55_101271 [Herbinix hemicellulosilytica]|uniref:DNA-directed RNA polymerase subunit M n=1 Tax=Herbinix hemicellulosilytica TaxID=1564487 RepID=A0A0H5SI97_HERHM|nr:hypothetical protein [Herbinix hemicellulosilytica]RBP60811.1 hypothetical protein DFR55_101271 [Herbinix hemicellulosilytica]CRZ34506.1 hypothetical protein HHT355_1304 [Herbinix hemicellulosilytica]HPU63917.1 hypothetical protein [Mobilitalea sp.]
MLRIFICPKCFNYRIVSRKPDATCFHCGARLYKSDLDYVDYIEMSMAERLKYKEKFIERMKLIKDNMDNYYTEQEMKK